MLLWFFMILHAESTMWHECCTMVTTCAQVHCGMTEPLDLPHARFYTEQHKSLGIASPAQLDHEGVLLPNTSIPLLFPFYLNAFSWQIFYFFILIFFITKYLLRVCLFQAMLQLGTYPNCKKTVGPREDVVLNLEEQAYFLLLFQHRIFNSFLLP